MKKIFTLICSAFICSAVLSQTLPIMAQWNFEAIAVSSTAATTPSLTTGTTVADAGIKAATSNFSASHTSASTVWSTPAGNGSSKSLSSNNWTVGDYYQFQSSTTGYTGIVLTFDQVGSGTGPGQWKLQYSTNGTTFTDFTTYTLPSTITSWSTTTGNPGSSFTFDLSSVTALNNAPSVYLRLTNNSSTATSSVNGSAVAATGSGRVDNFTVSGGTIFPLDLLSFNGSLNNTQVNLSWISTNEVNVGGFLIERSVNGKEFSTIGKVAAKGSIASNEYSFTDEKAVAGVSYYRLKMIDKDGAYKYSQTITIKGKTVGVSIYPNPVRSELTVQHEAALKGASVSILDLSGKQVISVNVQAGAVQTSLDAAKLAPGTYLVVYNNDGVRLTKQFVKQ